MDFNHQLEPIYYSNKLQPSNKVQLPPVEIPEAKKDDGPYMVHNYARPRLLRRAKKRKETIDVRLPGFCHRFVTARDKESRKRARRIPDDNRKSPYRVCK